MRVNLGGCAVILVLACTSAIVQSVSGQTSLDFSFMVSKPTSVNNDIEQDTSGVVPAVNLALDAINNDTTILSGYYLRYGNQLNSQCERTASLDAFFADITSPPNKVFLLGCGCSIATSPVGEISHFWEIVQMTYASLTPQIADRSSYPNLFSTLPTALSYQKVIHGIMNTFGWTRLVVVSQLENEFNMLREALVAANNTNGYVESITFHSSTNIAANPKLFNLEDDYRIYFLNMYERHARRVICKASDNTDIRYPRYVFIVPGTYHEQWWTVNDTSCTVDQLVQVLNYSLVIATYPVTDDEDGSTDVNLSYSEFLSMYNEEIESNNSLYSSFAAPFAYDALWAMALAMNNSVLTNPLSDFDNRMIGSMISKEIKRQLYSLSFTGLTGTVSFNLNGTRQETSPRVLQFRFTDTSSFSSDLVLIGIIPNITSNRPILEYVNNESNSTIWPIIIPYDGSPLSEIRAIVLPLSVWLYFIATVGIIFAISCSIVNFVLRKKKVIRLTSPNLNHLIVLGVILMMFSAYCFAYPASHYSVVYTLCIVRAFTQNIGYMLCFGTVCAKMGRVYFIFNNTSPSRKRRSIQDWHLLFIVLGLAGIDTVIATVALAIDPYKPTVVSYTENPTDTNEYGIQININSLVCESERSIIWIFALFFTKFIVQAAAVFFAFRTRKVKIKVLNDAKIISIIIYVTSALLTVMAICAIALSNYLNADAAVFGTGLVIVTAIVLMLLFIPKWYDLYKDPEGKNIFEGKLQQTFTTQPGGVSEQDAIKMANRIEELENRLSKHEAVTPSQPRKRFLSTAGDMSRSLGGSTAGLLRPGVAGGRSQSFSPSPLDVTASLPPRVYSPVPHSPLVPLNNGGSTFDSGKGTMSSTLNNDSANSSPKNPPVALTIEEVDESNNYNGLSSSQVPLTASTNF